MKKLLIASLALALSACADGYKSPSLKVSNPAVASAWEVGPILDGKSKSINVPARPYSHPLGLAIDIPYPNADAGHVHYVTFNAGDLAGKSKLTLRYRIELADGAQLRAASPPDWTGPTLLTLFFQRCGDNWTAVGAYESYRWFASFATVIPEAGDGEITVPLDGEWTAVMSSSRSSYPKGFRDALADTCRVGFVLGGGDGLGHGVYATGPARFIIKEFRVE